MNFELDQSNEDYKEFSGGSGYAFVSATDAFDAARKFKKEFKKEKMHSLVVKFIREYNAVLWEKTETYAYMDGLVEQAKNTNEVVFSEISGVIREAVLA
jgi:hypothetical protein